MATTHVFIVDKSTFKFHLEFLFAGTGARDYSIDFNDGATSTLSAQRENLLLAMIADSQRVRVGDYVIFYLQQSFQQSIREGKFYGIFRVRKTPSFLDHNDSEQYLASDLGKSLTFRTLIEPYRVYAHGVTEWEALDEIRNLQSPHQMLWSLIYRKLKGNRGNTMITAYESVRLRHLIREKNQRTPIASETFSFDVINQAIVPTEAEPKNYEGRREIINVLKRLIAKYKRNNQFETHLQAYIVQNLEGIDLFADEDIRWIGNEVSCGVGMQRIDIMLSVLRDDQPVCIPIELKSTIAQPGITIQIQRYVDWISQYYLPNSPCDVEPMLISRYYNKDSPQYLELIAEFEAFNARNGTLRLRYVEFKIDLEKGTIMFTEVKY